MENQIVCAHCNGVNSAKNLFCQNCGKPLTAARPVSPVQPIQPVTPLTAAPTEVSTPPSFQPIAPSVTDSTPQYPPIAPVPGQAVKPEVPPVPSPAPVPTSKPGSSARPGKVPQPFAVGENFKPISAISADSKINHSGILVESWADVIENGAELGASISDEFDRQMQERNIANLEVARKELMADGEPGGRTYHVLKNSRGGTMVVYFGALGKDLQISWDVFAKPVLNLINIAIILGGTAAVTLIITLISGVLNASFLTFLFSWVNRFYNWLFPVIVLTGLAGFILKGNLFAFLIKRPTKFDQDDLTGLMMIGHQVILKAVEAVGLDAAKLRAKKGMRGGSWFRKI